MGENFSKKKKLLKWSGGFLVLKNEILVTQNDNFSAERKVSKKKKNVS